MFEHQVFHVHCKYLKAHQEIVSNLIYTETLKSALSCDTKPITKVSLHCLVARAYLMYFFSDYFVKVPSVEPKTVVRSRYENDPKIFVARNSDSPIHDSWRELFKAIPVYLFLTALIEPCLHDMCRCLLSSHPFMFSCLICVGAFLVLSFFLCFGL